MDLVFQRESCSALRHLVQNMHRGGGGYRSKQAVFLLPRSSGSSVDGRSAAGEGHTMWC